MTISIAHSTVVVVPDDGTSPVGTDEWNDDHTIAGGTIMATDIASQVLSGGALVTVSDQGTKSSGTYTVDPGVRPLQRIVNNGAFTLAAPAADGSMILLITNGASAGAITFSGFSVGAATGDALTTTNTNKFSIHIWRINSIAGYRVAAHQ